MKNTQRTASLSLAAMLASLSFVLLYVGAVSGMFDMTASLVCGLLTMVLLRECGVKLTVCAVLACGALCFVLIPDKTVGVLYLTVSGIYPFVKPSAQRCRPAISWTIKLSLAVAIILLYVGAVHIFVPSEAGGLMIPVGLLFGVPCFVLYDILLTRFAVIYERRLRHIVKRK